VKGPRAAFSCQLATPGTVRRPRDAFFWAGLSEISWTFTMPILLSHEELIYRRAAEGIRLTLVYRKSTLILQYPV
jgi:hypothetical protein